MTAKKPTELQTKINAPCRVFTPNVEPQHKHNPNCVNDSGYNFRECIKCERKMLNFENQADKICINCEYEEKK
jgi:hypothetical protein